MSDEKAYEDATLQERLVAAQVLRKHRMPDGPVTIEMIRDEVERIRLGRFDAEQAHGREDALHERVLVAIAGGAPFPAVLAQEALKTREIDFPRWCA